MASNDPCSGKHAKRSRRIVPGATCNVTALLLCRPAPLLSASMRTAVTPGGTSYSWTTSHGICGLPLPVRIKSLGCRLYLCVFPSDFQTRIKSKAIGNFDRTVYAAKILDNFFAQVCRFSPRRHRNACGLIMTSILGTEGDGPVVGCDAETAREQPSAEKPDRQ